MASLIALQQNAVEWIALNDDPTIDDVEVIAMQLTVVMAADLLGTTPDKLARRVLDYRDATEFEKQLPSTKEFPATAADMLAIERAAEAARAASPVRLAFIAWRVIVLLTDGAVWGTAGAIAEKLRTTDGRMHAVLDELVIKGLAECRRQPQRRNDFYRLTTAGLALAPKARDVISATVAR